MKVGYPSACPEQALVLTRPDSVKSLAGFQHCCSVWPSLHQLSDFSNPPFAPVSLENSQRIRDLLRAGTINLSLQDALALAIENNLDIELQRFTLPQADTELQRAKGGGIVPRLELHALGSSYRRRRPAQSVGHQSRGHRQRY